MIHEDERRTLEDWPEAKIITTKNGCLLGNHYHKVKTEKFIMTEGMITMTVGNNITEMVKGTMYTIEPGNKHSFLLRPGSILIGLCSHPYDPSDDYR